MLFQIYSDIHAEHVKQFPQIPPLCDTLILAGDICIIYHSNFIPFMEYCSKHWKTVIYVLGNHEFYIRKYKINKYKIGGEEGVNIKNVILEYKKVLEPYSNIHCLENEYIDLNDEIRIYGSTLWTKHNCADRINDYDFIKVKYTDEWSNYEIECLEKYLQENTKKTIIVSHFPFIREGTSNPKYENNGLIEYFAWNDLLQSLPKENIIASISGHTHYSYDINHDNVHYISNQFGYMHELRKGETGFKINGLFEINL